MGRKKKFEKVATIFHGEKKNVCKKKNKIKHENKEVKMKQHRVQLALP